MRIAALFMAALSTALSIPPAAGSDEMSERDTIKVQVIDLVHAEDFAQLESLASNYRDSQVRTPSGVWKLTLYYDGVSQSFGIPSQDNGYWTRQEQVARKWVTAYPKSPTARIAYARYLLNRGWSYRGTGNASTVKPENWKPFQDYVQQARLYLEKHEAIASKDPCWYTMMEVIAYQQNWLPDEFSALLEEALTRYPSYYQIYFEAINYYAPKWGGDAASIERFARKATEHTKATDGYGMYARIYWSASQFQYRDRLFIDSMVDWPTMKQGIDDVLKAYPDQWNINNFAKFACLARDKTKAAELIKRIGRLTPEQVWGDLSFYHSCRKWALSA